MNLTSLVLDQDEARDKLAEYQEAISRERNVEDEAIAAAYRAAARGLPVISLTAAITAGGLFEDNGLPRIAIVRASARTCVVERRSDGFVFVDTEWDGRRDFRWRSHLALVGEYHVWAGVTMPYSGRMHHGTTVVPTIPPRHRPTRGGLDNFHILWEVERWDLTPPRDPALLRHIRGDLWSVRGAWDLTEIERMVLAQRANSDR